MSFHQQYQSYPGQSPNPQLIQHQQHQQQSHPQQQHQQQQQFRPSGYPPAGLMTPSNLSAMMAQGYAAQQQMLQQQQSGHPSGGAMSTPMRPPMGGMGMPGMSGMQDVNQQMMIAAQRQMQMQMNQSPSGSKKKKNVQSARGHQPRPYEGYVKGAMGMPGGEVEPWADALDELDGRELAMGRFRARQEILTEIFGPERINAWEGLGMDGETLEAKVLALEQENTNLEAAGDNGIESWRQSLQSMGEHPVAA